MRYGFNKILCRKLLRGKDCLPRPKSRGFDTKSAFYKNLRIVFDYCKDGRLGLIIFSIFHNKDDQIVIYQKEYRYPEKNAKKLIKKVYIETLKQYESIDEYKLNPNRYVQLPKKPTIGYYVE